MFRQIYLSFVKDTINFKIRDDLSVFIPHIFESIFIEIIPKFGKHTIIGVVYRPNSFPRADIDIFNSTLLEVLEHVTSENKIGILMGDMNIDLLKYGSHDKTDNYIDGIFARGFIPRILKPTRVTNTSATLLDHILTNDISAKYQSGIVINEVADHFGVFLSSVAKHRQDKPQVKFFRPFTEHNIAQFRSNLSRIDYSPVLHADSPDDAYSILFDLIRTPFEAAFPLRSTKSKSKHIKREPWMTEGLIKSSKSLSKLFIKKVQKPTQLNIECYKTHLNIFNKAKRRAKITYYKTVIEENKQNIKEMWKILNKAIGKENDKSGYPHSYTIDDCQVNDRDEISNAFNNFFANIGYKVNHSVPNTNVSFKQYMPNHNANSIFLDPISPTDVLNITNKLKPKTSSGADCISTKLLKNIIELIALPLTHIINRTFSTGIFPTALKCAKVVPIFKSGDPCLLNNYRPISLLPSISKIFEKIMYNKIMKFLNSNDILYRHQYGFRQKHSTIHPILHLLNQCAESNNSTPSKLTLATFCDLSKAFDTISTDILLWDSRDD